MQGLTIARLSWAKGRGSRPLIGCRGSEEDLRKDIGLSLTPRRILPWNNECAIHF